MKRLSKKVKVVILPNKTGVLSKCLKGYSDDPLLTFSTGQLRTETDGHEDWWQNQHLYFVSDEEIKEGDWTIDVDCELSHGRLTSIDNKVELDRYANNPLYNIKKVIATTNPRLSTCSKVFVKQDNTKAECVSDINSCCGKIANSRYLLPKIPKSFIESYVNKPVVNVELVRHNSNHSTWSILANF
jgi:hypothetical protein